MKCPVTTLDNKKAGEVELDDSIFGLEPRTDVLARMVNWQLAKRRAGTHKVKTRGEVQGSTAKIYRQKGTGRARHGSKRANIFRGGGRAFGPTPRDHGFELSKKFRKLGLKTALSAKAKEGKLVVLDSAATDSPKTKAMAARIAGLGWDSALVIDGAEIDRNFELAIRNLPRVDVLPSSGANVYDILRHDTLVLTKTAVEALEARLK